MENRFSELRCKEVINTCDGCRLGFVDDVVVDLKDGRVVALIVPGPCKIMGLVGPTENTIIPWHQICRIGNDIILVEVTKDNIVEPKQSIWLRKK